MSYAGSNPVRSANSEVNMNWKIAIAIIILVLLLTACGGIEEESGSAYIQPVPTADQLTDARGDSYEITIYVETGMARVFDKEACVLVYDAHNAVAVIQVDENSPLFLDCY